MPPGPHLPGPQPVTPQKPKGTKSGMASWLAVAPVNDEKGLSLGGWMYDE